jgi:hypothetical protein
MKALATRSICLGLVLISLADVAAGCGGSGKSGNSSNSNTTSAGAATSIADVQALDAAAGVKAKKAAAKVVNATTDKNLPGPKTFKVACAQAGEPNGPDNPNTVKCDVQAYYAAYQGKPAGYIFDEYWTVPIVNGRPGTPRISGRYQIRNFLRLDNRKNCTGRHLPSQCLPQSEGGQLRG